MYNINKLKDMLIVMEDCAVKLDNFNYVYNNVDNIEANSPVRWKWRRNF